MSASSSASELAKFEAAHCQARSLWSLGDPASHAKAKTLWSEVAKSTATSKAKVRLKISEALLFAVDPDPNKAAKATDLLEEMLKSDSAGTATAEAAIELGELYIVAKRFDDAQKSLNFVGKYLAKDNLVRLETTEVAAKPFRQAATAALKQLEFARDVGREPFEKAEASRAAKKFAEALPAYQAIVKEYPTGSFKAGSLK